MTVPNTFKSTVFYFLEKSSGPEPYPEWVDYEILYLQLAQFSEEEVAKEISRILLRDKILAFLKEAEIGTSPNLVDWVLQQIRTGRSYKDIVQELSDKKKYYLDCHDLYIKLKKVAPKVVVSITPSSDHKS